MKFDVVRAWKDEVYRKNLSGEELATLPSHPAGELELHDSELESVFGGGHEYGAGSSASYAGDERPRSYAIICEINVFSINLEVLNLNLVSIGTPRTRVCVHHG